TLDLLLPDMHGWDVLGEIRSTVPNRNTPVIAVTVAPEHGQTIGFRLHDYLTKPVSQEAVIESLARLNVKPTGNRTVLVIDDDPDALRFIDAVVRELGYSAVCVSNAREGLREAALDPPAVLVVDLLMPGVDGFEFLARFRDMPGASGVPVIVWTGKDLDANDRRRLHAAAATVGAKDAGGVDALIEQINRVMNGGTKAEQRNGG